MRDSNYSLDHLRSILIEINAEALHETAEHPHRKPLAPFVTISRQTGAGAADLAEKLAERLNASDKTARAWMSWDRELVERVAADHHLSKDLVQNLGEPGQGWLTDFLAGLSSSSDTSLEESGVYHLVTKLIATIAAAGKAIIVGRGGVFVTRGLPGGIHVRLVAPMEKRIEEIARRTKGTQSQAARYVHAADAARRAFYHRYWPKGSIEPETFTVTFNSAELTVEQMVDCLAEWINKLTARAEASTVAEKAIAS